MIPSLPRQATPEGRLTSVSPTRLVDRRTVLKALAVIGVGSCAYQRAVAMQVAENGHVTAEMIAQAEWIAGLSLSEEDRRATAATVESVLSKITLLRQAEIDYFTPPAILFQPSYPETDAVSPQAADNVPLATPLPGLAAVDRPDSPQELAYLPVTALASLLRDRKVTSLELTRLYLERLREYDPALLCVVSLTEETALAQAEQADREIAAGHYRGPLHGIPWGAKDLISWPGYPTTWGAAPFKDQVLDLKATVARRLEEAGAVLVAKLSLGSLAWGDQWHGGMTRNPWNGAEGSSGSSAGSAAAAAAGLVGFSIGSETLGSIVSPCRRCGVTGLRPTFGRVSRHGCMPLAWSMDKLGPIARSVEDCALVFAAIHGADSLDPTAVTRPFDWPCPRPVNSMTVGYFENDTPAEDREELQVLEKLGVKLVPVRLPRNPAHDALTLILGVEAATVFDGFTRRNAMDGLGLWPPTFRQAQFVPAIEYLRANRLRTRLMREMEELMRPIDAYVGGDDLVITNLTGHPTVVMPSALKERAGRMTPSSITFTGKLFGESVLLALAHAWQQATGFHLARPDLDALVAVPKE